MNEIEKIRKWKHLSGMPGYSLQEKLFKFDRGGNLYIIQLGNTDVFKIGVSVNPERRLKQLQSKCPIPLKIIYQKFGHDYEWIEKFLHYKFRDERVKGEWFQLSLDDLLWINSIFTIEYFDPPGYVCN